MNAFTQGESSSAALVHVPREKRRRGRLPKDLSLKGSDETECVVGQPIAGFVESSFDDGYLLTVRIGSSATSLRGVVFKPGHLAPITDENDVAPRLQMIRRENAYFPSEKRGRSRRPKLGITKLRNATPSAPPVVLQPVVFPPDSSRTPQLAFGDKDVHHVEPLSIISPDQVIGQRFQGSISNQVHQGNQQSVTAIGIGAKLEVEPTESTDADDMTSSETWEDESKSSGDNDSGNEAKLESRAFPVEPAHMSNFTGTPHNGPVSSPLFSYGTGRMTQLLQAVQENIKDKKMQVSEQQIPSTSKVQFNGLGTSASHSNS